jgi:hypothetical protein
MSATTGWADFSSFFSSDEFILSASCCGEVVVSVSHSPADRTEIDVNAYVQQITQPCLDACPHLSPSSIRYIARCGRIITCRQDDICTLEFDCLRLLHIFFVTAIGMS